MKLSFAVALLVALVFAGCATENISNTTRPYVFIANAKKIGNGPRASSDFDVTVHYKNVVPEKSEIKIGFGYVPSPDSKEKFTPSAAGIYAVAYTQVLHDSAGELHITINPQGVLKFRGTMDGKLHAVLSKYPHGEEWPVEFHDVYALDPE